MAQVNMQELFVFDRSSCIDKTAFQVEGVGASLEQLV